MTKKKVTKTRTLKSEDRKILQILKDNPEGLRAPTLLKLSNLKERSLYRYLNKLKDMEILEKYSTIWKICHNQINSVKLTELLRSDKIQIHDLSFVIKLIRVPDWWEKRSNNLRRLKEYQFKKNVNWGNNPYTQLLKDHFLIHCFKNSILFINQKKYYGNDPYECFIEAHKDFLEALRYFEERIRFKLFLDEIPHISVRSNHIVQIGHEIAKRCKRRGEEYEIVINGERRGWVDLSKPFGFELGHKDYAVEDTARSKYYIEDIIVNNPPTASQISQGLNQATQLIQKNTSNLDYHAENMKTHVGAIKELADGVKKNNEIMEKILKALEKK